MNRVLVENRTMDTEIQLYNEVKQLHDRCDWVYDAIDIGVTISKITEQQRLNLLSMIETLTSDNKEQQYILGNVMHDLNGLNDEIQNEPYGFSPRSFSYCKRTEPTEQARKPDREPVDVIASGYEWTCPICGMLINEIEYTEQVTCGICSEDFKTNFPEHACR